VLPRQWTGTRFVCGRPAGLLEGGGAINVRLGEAGCWGFGGWGSWRRKSAATFIGGGGVFAGVVVELPDVRGWSIVSGLGSDE
jgi:hypothetical protein